MFLTKQEVEVRYILPLIRKEYSLTLKKLGYKQKEIAKFLNLTESAVSQYLSSKRANNIEISIELKEEIELSAKKVIDNSIILNMEIQKLVNLFSTKRNICMIHKKFSDLPNGCDVCFNDNIVLGD